MPPVAACGLGKLALGADSSTKLHKQYRNGYHQRRCAPQERVGPLDVDAIVHVGREHGEAGPGDGPGDGVGRDGRRSTRGVSEATS